MKTFSLLIILLSPELSVISYAQPIRIDVGGSGFVENSQFHDTLNWTRYDFDESERTCVYPSFYFKVSYLVNSLGLQPTAYATINPLVKQFGAGIERPFKVSYSEIAPEAGIGYAMHRYWVGGEEFNTSDVNYWLGFAVYSPFVKDVDFTFEYRLIFAKSYVLGYTNQNPFVADVRDSYYTETFNPRHLLTGGISIVLGKGKKRK